MNQSVTRPQLLVPGVRALPLGTERYPIPGGGCIVVSVSAGDKLEVIDSQGLQQCEVAVFDKFGVCNPDILGGHAPAQASGITTLLSGDSESARAIGPGLKKRNIQFTGAKALHLFNGGSHPGERATLTAEADGFCVIAAPGGPMRVDEQNPPTDLVVFIHRTEVVDDTNPVLPDPLADARYEHLVEPGTAHVYEVKAGEYIQIIDVEGRECSDFQCFTVAGLDQQLERCIDATTTRTLMGAAYPGPGLFSKFYDIDQQPLVELLHDTCGRHDFFGLACTAKYYDDLGYPGHVNCSDNFNRELSPYPIVARRGWEAINFFYNTNLDDNLQLFLDDPWSRPGDYVLVKALADMVCISSACPCDIDAANGWNPTPIHVRVYPEKNTFSKAIAYRMTTDADPQLTKETGFHPRTSALTRNYTEYNGYWLANTYNNHGAIAEYWACREGVIVTDLSPLRKFEITGPDAEALMQWTVTRNMRRLSVGQVVYTPMVYDTGGMIDEGTVLRLGQDNFRWIGGTDYSGIWLRKQAEERAFRAWVRSSTSQMCNISIQGPKSREVLKEVVWTPPAQPTLEELGWFRFTIGRIGHVDGVPIVVSRTGYTGELGYEVWCHPKDALALWDAVWESGLPHKITPLGLEALDLLRIESGLVSAGAEWCDQTDPFEAGIGFTVPLKSKEDDFVGREALLRRKANPHRKLVGLELAGEEIAANGDYVHIERAQIGEVTSAMRSPSLRKNIALCRLAVEHSEVGTEVEVGKLDGHQKRLPATVVRFPFYDPDKTRPRS